MTDRTALLSTVAVVLAAALGACGSEPTPAVPAAPTASPAPPPAPAPTGSGSAAATGPTTAPAPAPAPASATKYDVGFFETKLAPDPDVFPKLTVDVPGYDQAIPSSVVGATKVRFKVANFEKLPKGSYVQFILDNQPYTPVTDPHAPVDLAALGPGGTVAEGDHVLAALVCRKTGESIKHPDAFAIRRFWTGKKTPPKWDSSRGPLLVVGHPYGTYKGDAADDILFDWFLVNMPNPPLDRKGYTIRALLKGPGIPDDGIQRVINEWHTHLILSAHDGTYTLQADLLDKNGDIVPGPGNSTTRTFTVAR